MAKKLTLGDLADKHMPILRDAFLTAVHEITSKVRVTTIIRALERGDIQEALNALYIDRAAFRVFENALATAFQAGGVTTAGGLEQLKDPEGSRFIIRFDSRNPRAEQWLQEHSANLVTRIVEDQKLALRQYMTEGMMEGRNPRTTALAIAGRVNRLTGRREGGLIGLSAPQEEALRRARRELQEGRYADFLKRKLRDKRLDKTLAKAAKDGRSLTAAEINKMLTRYSAALLKLRSETIARTEALASLHAAQDQALRQLVDSGKVAAHQVRRVWDATGDFRTRPEHMVADSQSVGMDEKFNVGGRFMSYPGDPNGGPENVINCRCYLRVRIDYLANLR